MENKKGNKKNKNITAWKVKLATFVAISLAYICSLGWIATYASNHALKALIHGISTVKLMPTINLLYVGALTIAMIIANVIICEKNKKNKKQ